MLEYSNVPNKHACTFISGKVCPLTLIEPKRQTLPGINVHACLFGTLEQVNLPTISSFDKGKQFDQYLEDAV